MLKQSPKIGIHLSKKFKMPFKKKLEAERVKLAWGECKEDVKKVLRMFSAFREQRRICIEQFRYWDNFLTQIFPVICDLTRSCRKSNWELHLSAIHRALPLFCNRQGALQTLATTLLQRCCCLKRYIH